MRTHVLGAVIALTLGLCACTSDPPAADRSTSPTPEASATPTPTSTATGTATAEPTAPEVERPPVFDAARALGHVEVLAGRIGPRLADGPAFREAGRYVARRFRSAGYAVHRQHFPVPAGDSWGVPVQAGRSFNVVATPPGFDEGKPYRIVGAHLDSVAVAPGAEDNASGISVLLELARLLDAWEPERPTVLVAFGAEEPRGPGDLLHHFGSRFYVEQMSRQAAANLEAMVALDRVGVGRRVPVWSAIPSRTFVSRSLQAAGRAANLPVMLGSGNTTSDHWSFVKAGLPAARVGSTDYPEYHSASDVPGVVDERQLERTGRLLWKWLRGPVT